MNKIYLFLKISLIGIILSTSFSQKIFAKAASKQVNETKQEIPDNPAESFIITNEYVHNWIRFPDVIGQKLFDAKKIEQKPIYGIVDVLIFIASWCTPCQRLMNPLKELENTYKNNNARFTYVFAHDLISDARKLASIHKIEDAILATHDTLKTFHNPALPMIYVGDRNNWLLLRFQEANPKNIKTLDKLLKSITSY